MPRRILICSRRDDQHALIVAVALKKCGANAVVWDMQDYPAHQRISLNFSAAGDIMTVEGLEPGFATRCDAIWLRRIAWDGRACGVAGAPLDLPGLHSAIFMDRILDLFPRHARWVNFFPNAICAEYKPSQLRAATVAGFQVPETLVSNDPETIRRFSRSFGEFIVAKPLRAEYLKSRDGSMKSLRTEYFSESLITDDRALELGPYIFQQKIDAAFEVRVTVIGNHVFAARLDVQGDGGVIDSHYKKCAIEEFALPAAIEELCTRLGARLGLVFFCVDLLVTSDGKFYFLELNQAGQFLGLEYAVPSCRCLAAFCALLLGSTEQLDLRLAAVLVSPEYTDMAKRT